METVIAQGHWKGKHIRPDVMLHSEWAQCANENLNEIIDSVSRKGLLSFVLQDLNDQSFQYASPLNPLKAHELPLASVV